MDFDRNSSDFAEKIQRCREYMKGLESELKKIQVFERELPLCLELVTQAIEGCRQQISGTMSGCINGQSECSEQTTSDGPVLEEFIPLKRISSADDHEEDEHEHEEKQKQKQDLNHKSKIISCKLNKSSSSSSSKKLDWLRSAQLSIQTPDPLGLSPKRVQTMGVKRDGCGAFHPFKKEKWSVAAPAAGTAKLSADSTAETGGGDGGCGGNKGEDKGQLNRKARRCWSPELHRRFLHALQQLGGAHVATPKQIRELMKVDGLTNDEVKSHLQKYRLHTRRPCPTIHDDNSRQTPQFVVVGGLWMPPPDYTAMAANAPMAHHPSSMTEASMSLNKSDFRKEDGDCSHDDSPTTSSSTHTTTASPAF
ncbi:hypothetical protein R6Q57_014834 [Mikania cordata]